MELLRRLSELVAPSGREDDVRDLMIDVFRSYDLNVEYDDSGNVIAYKSIDKRPLVLSAHMDEIGIIVNYIDQDGFVRILPLGGYLPEYLLSKDVVIYGREIVEGSVHREFLEDWEDESRKLKFKNLFVQTELSKEELEKVLYPGAVGGIKVKAKLGKSYISGKALDDRIGLYILSELAKDLPDNVILMGSTEEEVSHYGKGAANAVWKLEPRLFIAVDVGEANDYPGGERYTKLEAGPEITVRELRGIGNVIKGKYLDMIDKIAKREGILLQYRITKDSATEASNVFHLKGGIPSLAICTPIRYIHTFNEYASIKDIENTIRLLKSLLNTF